MVSRPGPEDIRLDRVRESRSEGELVILKFSVELKEGAFPQIVIAFDQKRAVGALGERPLLALLIEQDAEFHIDVG